MDIESYWRRCDLEFSASHGISEGLLGEFRCDWRAVAVVAAVVVVGVAAVVVVVVVVMALGGHVLDEEGKRVLHQYHLRWLPTAVALFCSVAVAAAVVVAGIAWQPSFASCIDVNASMNSVVVAVVVVVVVMALGGPVLVEEGRRVLHQYHHHH